MFLLACAIENDKQPAGPSVSRSQIADREAGGGRGCRGRGSPLWPQDGCNVIVRAGMKSALTK